MTNVLQDSIPVSENGVCLQNPHLQGRDYLYHFGLTTDDNLKERFQDVKYLCMGGKGSRMKNFANFIYNKLGKPKNCEFDSSSNGDEPKLKNIAEGADRYCLYKVGPVLSANHGIGSASMSVALHELLKLLHYANCTDVTVIRVGTSGGLGLEPGTVVITRQAYNSLFQPGYRQVLCGKEVIQNCEARLDICDELRSCASALNISAKVGNTMATDDFYEEQGRLDGALCSFTEEDKMNFLRKAHDEHNILNVEMECACWIAMCNRANVKCAVVCVTLLNRLLGDSVTDDVTKTKQWELHPQEVVAEYISRHVQ